MNVYIGPLVIDERLGSETRTIHDTTGLEAAIHHLRAAGEGKIGCIRVLVKACGYSLRDAKRVVHFSAAWDDRRANDDAFHDEIEAAVTILNAQYEAECLEEFKKAS